ncbi:MAG: outer membrane protein assembly factor BamC [Bdellovibrionales bacterium]|nr:outer membrane protein assembly factor BamC [Bdellovibrionales bacterium]
MNKKSSHWRTFLVLAFLCSGCVGSKSFKEPLIESSKSVATARIYAWNYENVWDSTKDALDRLNIAVSEMSRERGIIVTDWASGKSDLIYSGYGEAKIPYTVRYKFLIQMVNAGTKVKVGILNKEEYMTDTITSESDFEGSLYKWVPTKSSGKKENELLEEISRQLRTSSR